MTETTLHPALTVALDALREELKTSSELRPEAWIELAAVVGLARDASLTHDAPPELGALLDDARLRLAAAAPEVREDALRRLRGGDPFAELRAAADRGDVVDEQEDLLLAADELARASHELGVADDLADLYDLFAAEVDTEPSRWEQLAPLAQRQIDAGLVPAIVRPLLRFWERLAAAPTARLLRGDAKPLGLDVDALLDRILPAAPVISLAAFAARASAGPAAAAWRAEARRPAAAAWAAASTDLPDLAAGLHELCVGEGWQVLLELGETGPVLALYSAAPQAALVVSPSGVEHQVEADATGAQVVVDSAGRWVIDIGGRRREVVLGD